jgi:proteasome alpha subunit
MNKDIVEDALVRSNPIIAGEYDRGIMLLAENPSASLFKISEIYDRIAFAGTGVYNDYEKLRKSGVQYADLRGFTYSRKDVSAKSIAGEYSAILGDIFSHQQVPLEVEIMVVELGESPADNLIYHIAYSGGLIEKHGFAVIGDIHRGGEEDKVIKNTLEDFLSEKPDPRQSPLEAVFGHAYEALNTMRDRELAPGRLEMVILDRTLPRERKFHRLSGEDIQQLMTS